MSACTCDPDDRYTSCDVHVSCDEQCRALYKPTTLDEYKAALDHWMSHGWLKGCSHAC